MLPKLPDLQQNDSKIVQPGPQKVKAPLQSGAFTFYSQKGEKPVPDDPKGDPGSLAGPTQNQTITQVTVFFYALPARFLHVFPKFKSVHT